MRLLEILGRAITVDTTELILQWLSERTPTESQCDSSQSRGLRKVVDLMTDLQLNKAQEQLRLYLFENPTCTKGRLAAAALCLHNNNLEHAVEQLSSVYVRQPNNTLALYVLGHCYERLGKEHQAVEFYQDCLKFKGYLKLPAQRLAAIYFKNGQVEKTIQQYQSLAEQYPDDISNLVTLGYLYVATGRYSKAIETFNAAILLHPDNFLAQDDDVDELIHSGQLHEAIERLNELLETQPDRPDLVARQADILSMLGATADAISQYQRALRLCPDFLEAAIKLGTLYLRIHAEQIAAQQFNRAAEINDRIVDAYVGLAIAQKLGGNDSSAMTTLSLAAAIQPNTSVLFARTADLIFRTALLPTEAASPANESACDLITAAIRAHHSHIMDDPHNPDLHYRLGLLLMSIDRFCDAASCFNHALKANPSHTRALVKLALCVFETGHPDEALSMLTSADHLERETLELHYKTALLYCDKLRFASSLLNLQRRIDTTLLTSSDPAPHISVVLQNLGLSDRAIDMWDNLTVTAAHVPTGNLT